MKRLILIGGGNLKEKTTKKIDEYIISLTNKNRPNLLFIPQASNDYNRVISNFKVSYEELANIKILDDMANYEDKIKDIDIIYISGGDISLLMKKLNETGFDKVLIDLYEKGVIISGISAGAICFFEYGYSDKYAFNDNGYCNFNLVKCLGIIKGMCTPHYNYEGKEIYNEVVKKSNNRGFAIEDDTALCIFDDKFFSVKSNNKNGVYLIDYDKILKEVK